MEFMEAVLENAAYNGVAIDLDFIGEQPMFGDLFLICGYPHLDFLPSGRFQFERLSDLNFSQVDDYFGMMATEEEGADVIIWLYPLVGEEEVYHHQGPFTGLRLTYNILRNPPHRISAFLRVVPLFAQYLKVKVTYELRDFNLGRPPDMTVVEDDINQIVKFWQEKGITPGSESALRVIY